MSTLIKETKVSNKQSNFTSQETKREQTKPKVSRRKEINEIENNKTAGKKSIKLGTGFAKINKVDKTLAKLMKKKRKNSNKFFKK